MDTYLYKAGFLKSSPKIVLYAKPPKNNGFLGTASGEPPFSHSPSPKPVNATWICPICSFSNPVPAHFDPASANTSTELLPCLACGIKPPLTTVLKAAITAAANHDTPAVTKPDFPRVDSGKDRPSLLTPLSCPRCTFMNHPSLPSCEMCGAPLPSSSGLLFDGTRSDSVSPVPFSEQQYGLQNTEAARNIKLSFRDGGDRIFYERMKGALVQRKWLLHNAPPVPEPSQSPSPTTTLEPTLDGIRVHPSSRPSAVGIAGLEQRGLQARINNELVIGNAFEDLEALMSSAKQVVALAGTLARESGMASNSNEGSAEANAVLSESVNALGMVTTKDMLGSGAENLYLSELSRDLAEYLTDDRRGILHRRGGIMSLVDLWAVFNRSRNGVELVSPSDFEKAARLWELLKLPVRLRQFKSGLMVVQRHDWTDKNTIQQLQAWMEELRRIPPAEPVPWDWRMFGRSVTAWEAAGRFKWSVGVAAEELEMAEDNGVLCREEGIEGLRFWINKISGPDEIDTAGIVGDLDAVRLES